MPLLASKQHTAGDTKRWRVNYSRWLDNTASIDQIDIVSSSTTCTVADISILGHEVIFFLVGGLENERLTLALTMVDNFGNIKNDTLIFTVIAP